MQLYALNLDAYVDESYHFYTYSEGNLSKVIHVNHFNAFADAIIKNAQQVSNISVCLDKLRRNHRVMCISNEGNFIGKIEQGMQIAKPVFYCEYYYYPLKARSPYRRRAQKMFNRLLETGVYTYFKPPMNTTDFVWMLNDELQITLKILLIV